MAAHVIEKPIFVVGIGRSGSTVFHRMFAKHPHVAWLYEKVAKSNPSQPARNGHLMRVLDWPVVGDFLDKRLKPGEGYDFWEHHSRGFRRPFRDLIANDVTPKNRQDLTDALTHFLTAKRHRLLFKLTGWPRIRFLNEIFPDAKFIHIVRDGRAVVNSLINVDWWHGWEGPHNWRWGLLSDEQHYEWEKYERSFVALAAIEWKIIMDTIVQAAAQVPAENYLEIRYEDLCVAPVDIFEQVTNFCQLAWTDTYATTIANYPLRSRNSKWRQDLNLSQQQMLEDILASHLGRYGYELELLQPVFE